MWYVVSTKWSDKFWEWCGFNLKTGKWFKAGFSHDLDDAPFPGPVDNSDLRVDSKKIYLDVLRSPLTALDYIAVCEPLYDFLWDTFNTDPESYYYPMFPRFVHWKDQTSPTLNLYPTLVQFLPVQLDPQKHGRPDLSNHFPWLVDPSWMSFKQLGEQLSVNMGFIMGESWVKRVRGEIEGEGEAEQSSVEHQANGHPNGGQPDKGNHPNGHPLRMPKPDPRNSTSPPCTP